MCLAVLASPALVEHALRNTLVADALSLQFRLPPSGQPATSKSQVCSLLVGLCTKQLGHVLCLQLRVRMAAMSVMTWQGCTQYSFCVESLTCSAQE